MSLRLRLLLTVAMTFGLVVVGCVYAAHLSASHQLRSAADQFLTQRAARFTDAPSGALQSDPSGDLDGAAGPNPNPHVALADPDALTQILNTNANIVSSIRGQPALPVDAQDRTLAKSGGSNRFRDATVAGTAYRILTVPLPHGGAAQVALSLKSDNHLLATLDLRLLFIALAGTALAASLAWFIARRTVRPIEQLTVATAYVAETRNLAKPIPIERRDELGRLATSFNMMLAALNTSREQQRRLVLDASHELRTPLTAVRTNIEVLARARTISDADRVALLTETDAELKELTELVTELVELATDARADEPLQRVDLGELTEHIVARQQRRSQRQITLELRDPCEIDVRTNMLERAVSNLVDNALKFSPADSTVDVVVDHTRIEILDRGPGIEVEDRDRVFDRFYRSGKARTRPGSGLGLAIVQEIADLHGASVTLTERSGGGIIATLKMPDPDDPDSTARHRSH